MRQTLVAIALAASPALMTGDVLASKKSIEAVKASHGTIVWKVEPENVVIFLDGRKLGTAATAKSVKTKTGMHLVRMVWGRDEAEEPMRVEAGQTVEFNFTFEDSGAGGTSPPQQ